MTYRFVVISRLVANYNFTRKKKEKFMNSYEYIVLAAINLGSIPLLITLQKEQ